MVRSTKKPLIKWPFIVPLVSSSGQSRFQHSLYLHWKDDGDINLLFFSPREVRPERMTDWKSDFNRQTLFNVSNTWILLADASAVMIMTSISLFQHFFFYQLPSESSFRYIQVVIWINNNSIYLARKHVRTFILGCYLFRDEKWASWNR